MAHFWLPIFKSFGIMEYWKIGILRIPLFHTSNIPIFHIKEYVIIIIRQSLAPAKGILP